MRCGRRLIFVLLSVLLSFLGGLPVQVLVSSTDLDPFQYATRGEEPANILSLISSQTIPREDEDIAAQEFHSGAFLESFDNEGVDATVLSHEPARGTATKAYVTRILNWRHELPAACALAYSIASVVYGIEDISRISAGDVELVALVESQRLPRSARFYLEKCGYRVVPVQPQLGIPDFLRLPLASWSLTEYKAVIFIEPISLVLSPSVQELFHCGCFCAAVQTGEYFSAGVFGLRPSLKVHSRMLEFLRRDVIGLDWPPAHYAEKHRHLFTEASRSLGAFLNTYFRDFLRAPYFPQKIPAEHIDEDDMEYGELMRSCCDDPILLVSSLRLASDPNSVCVRRLPIGYNGDPVFHGVFSNTRVIRFTAPLTPYAWWSAWVIGNKAAWRASRRALGSVRARFWAAGPPFLGPLMLGSGLMGLAAAIVVLLVSWREARHPFLGHWLATVLGTLANVQRNALIERGGQKRDRPFRFWSRLRTARRPSAKSTVDAGSCDPESSCRLERAPSSRRSMWIRCMNLLVGNLCGLVGGLVLPATAWLMVPTYLPAPVGAALFASLCVALQHCTLSVLRFYFQRRCFSQTIPPPPPPPQGAAFEGARHHASERDSSDTINAIEEKQSRGYPRLGASSRHSAGLQRNAARPLLLPRYVHIAHFIWWIVAPQIPILFTRNIPRVITIWVSSLFIYDMICCLGFAFVLQSDAQESC